MYLKFLQKPRCLGWFKSALIRCEENKVEFLERQFHREKVSFVYKKKLSILLNFYFLFVFYRRIFNLEIQSFSLENHCMMNARQTFC